MYDFITSFEFKIAIAIVVLLFVFVIIQYSDLFRYEDAVKRHLENMNCPYYNDEVVFQAYVEHKSPKLAAEDVVLYWELFHKGE